MTQAWVQWLPVVRRYVLFSAVVNLIWEFAQMPLYTLWYEATVGEIVYAAVHCTIGDVLIASASLLLSLVIAGVAHRQAVSYPMVVLITLATGLAYTIFSEWLNTEIRGSWAYAELMPTVPIIGAGLSPLLQWIVVPIAGLGWARRTFNRGETA